MDYKNIDQEEVSSGVVIAGNKVPCPTSCSPNFGHKTDAIPSHDTNLSASRVWAASRIYG